ncbi:MAG: gliding motility-associated C-terminal domain-containing protein [Bacteroidia bacterium]
MRYVLRNLFILIFLTCMYGTVHATHNRSGEITYSYLGGNTYKIRITTYTNNGSGSLQADRCWQTVYIDNLLDSIFLPRVNGSPGCTNDPQGPAMMGVDLTPAGQSSGYRVNVYEANYTFTGNSWHILYMFDPNRNAGSNNIPNSVQQTFALVDTIFTGNAPGFGSNNSPILNFPPIDEACAGQPFIHNPGAYDPDHDSLSYSLTTCLGNQGLPIGGYTIPSNVSINAVTGDLTWNSPPTSAAGEYNFAILITEWRKDLDGVYHVVGKTLRDLQVNVIAPCNNLPPDIVNIKDTCIIAGTNFTQLVTATDPNNDLVTLSANGGPFNINPSATFNSTPSTSTVTGTFNWTPNCGQVSVTPYLVTIKALDNHSQVPLVDFASFFIKVIGPPPQNLTAVPSGASIVLNWQPPVSCSQFSGNMVVTYLIYRKQDCVPWLHAPCETGVPAYTGFVQVGSINAIGVSSPTFTDNNNGAGLVQGVDYSYIVVAQFADGAQSYASNQVCYHIIRDVPVIINASVDTTDAATGKIWVRWLKPLLSTATVANLDTLANPGPYEFRLMQHTGFSGTFGASPVYSVSKPYFAQINTAADTSFTDSALNTFGNPYTYRVDFYCNGTLKGSTQTASSVFLTATGLARRVQLTWQAQVPWNNYFYYIYKQNATGNYLLIDSTSATVYTDSNLVDGMTYCYKIKTVGKYSDPGIYSPLVNWSQKACAVPVDNEAPCAPTISAVGDCITQTTVITWNNPNNSCSDDAVYYNLYYTPILDSQMVKIDSLPINITLYQTDFASSIAGCYAITAVDSFKNESAPSVVSCVDNCPEYELPNIITINGDSINDYFIPVKNRFVKDIDLKVYNRWGSLVFETTLAAINWDGRNKLSKLPCTDGTYYYTCDVHMIRYTGIETKKLKGFLQILKN